MIDGRSLIPTDDPSLFVFQGDPIFLVTVDGDKILCREGDTLRLAEDEEGDWLTIEEVISRPLN